MIRYILRLVLISVIFVVAFLWYKFNDLLWETEAGSEYEQTVAFWTNIFWNLTLVFFLALVVWVVIEDVREIMRRAADADLPKDK